MTALRIDIFFTVGKKDKKVYLVQLLLLFNFFRESYSFLGLSPRVGLPPDRHNQTMTTLANETLEMAEPRGDATELVGQRLMFRFGTIKGPDDKIYTSILVEDEELRQNVNVYIPLCLLMASKGFVFGIEPMPEKVNKVNEAYGVHIPDFLILVVGEKSKELSLLFTEKETLDSLARVELN